MHTILDLFHNSVSHFKDHPALIEPVEGGEIATLTYGMVQERARGFAGYLQQQGVQKSDRILIWCASRADWMCAYLGTLLLGATMVPLDVSSKEDFIRKLVETTEAKLLITTGKQYAGLKQPPLPFVDIDALPQETLDASRLLTVTGDDLAELVFTSGTTGQPKGVMLTHNNIASNALAAMQVVRIQTTDRVLSILPLSHMFEMTIQVALLGIGASIVYARTLSPDTLLKLLAAQQVTFMVLVPQALQLFLNGIEREVRRQQREKQWETLLNIATRLPFGMRRYLFGAVHKRFGGQFRFFVSGGAYLPLKLAARWETLGFRVLQGYGATECAPMVSATPYNEHILDSVGKALPGETVRTAEDGEILVQGSNVALGYWKSPEATAAAFQDGWYHTGDLGSIDAKGNLYLKGRKKNLIVLANGLNVYPEDIENVLLTNPLIKDAVVFGLMEHDEGPVVHSVLLMEDASKAKTAIQQANKQLASHQQIRGYTLWPDEDFPRTHTLKVKRPEVFDKLQTLHKPTP